MRQGAGGTVLNAQICGVLQRDIERGVEWNTDTEIKTTADEAETKGLAVLLGDAYAHPAADTLSRFKDDSLVLPDLVDTSALRGTETALVGVMGIGVTPQQATDLFQTLTVQAAGCFGRCAGAAVDLFQRSMTTRSEILPFNLEKTPDPRRELLSGADDLISVEVLTDGRSHHPSLGDRAYGDASRPNRTTTGEHTGDRSSETRPEDFDSSSTEGDTEFGQLTGRGIAASEDQGVEICAQAFPRNMLADPAAEAELEPEPADHPDFPVDDGMRQFVLGYPVPQHAARFFLLVEDRAPVTGDQQEIGCRQPGRTSPDDRHATTRVRQPYGEKRLRSCEIEIADILFEFPD